MKAFWEDLKDSFWPRHWLVCVDISTGYEETPGTMLIVSQHRTKADAVMNLRPGITEHVMHVDELADYAIQFRN